jgi:curved DNA-binding protein CbpA
MPPARTHYDLLNVDRSADPADIKAAFREQIARYHPDKVSHLGREFQDLAVQKTAELTTAYKTLVSPTLRAQYDASLNSAATRMAIHDASTDVAGAGSRFAAERAGSDDIVYRAVIGRVRSAVVDLYGEVTSHRVRAFDLVLVPTAGPPLMRSPFPRVFAKLRDVVDAPHVRESCADAVRAGLHVAGSPINVLLFGRRLGSEARILSACETVRSERSRDVPAKTYVVVIDSADWRACFTGDAPPALRRFIDRLRTF